MAYHLARLEVQAWVALLASCQPANHGSETEVNASGTLLYGDQQLVQVSDTTLIVIDRIAERATFVEVEGSKLSATRDLLAPEGCHTPLNAVASDLNMDGHRDVLVTDSTCGTWFGLGSATGDLNPVPSLPSIPGIDPSHYLYYEDLNGDARPELVSAWSSGFAGFSHTPDGRWQRFSGFPSPPWSATRLSNRVLLQLNHEGTSVTAFLGGGKFSLLGDKLSGETPVLEELVQTKLEYLKPYDGYDQIVSIHDPGCSEFAVGIGYFDSSEKLPRRAVVLRAGEAAGTYEASALATVYEDVIALTTLELEGTNALAIVSRADGTYAFELLQSHGCGQYKQLFILQSVAFHAHESSFRSGDPLTCNSTTLTCYHADSTWIDTISLTRNDDGIWTGISDATNY